MSLLLKKPIFDGISNQELVEQLEARKKCEKKLPTWFRTPTIYYPNKRNIAQTSSEITARYKAEIVSGKSLLDATGGLGVDSYFFSQKIDRVYHCEIEENLSRIAVYNFSLLDTKNINSITVDGLKFLTESKTTFDWVYLDPSRRNNVNRKVFMLSDCNPNVLDHLDLFFSKTDHIILKTAPLLDLSLGIKELKSVKHIHVVAVNNDVKELLWVLQKGYNGDVEIKTINFEKDDRQTFDFSFEEEKTARTIYSQPLSYLYEPNSAILKSGAFKTLANRIQLKKLHEHTHLYTSTDLLAGFPGKIFKIERTLPYSKKTLRQFDIKKANVKTRNFPEKVEEVRKNYKIKDGGTIYLFFIKDSKDKLMMLICNKA